MVTRSAFFIVLVSLIWVGQTFYDASLQPDLSTNLAIQSVNGGSVEAANVRLAHQAHNQVPFIALGLTLVAFLACYGAYIKRGVSKLKENV